MQSGIIIDNNGEYTVNCQQEPNNDNELYCECLQADKCIEEWDEWKTIYQYRSGEQILEPFSYKVK